MSEENIVKKTCKELNLTYKQLGELIGLSEGSIKRLATSDEINTQVVKSCELVLEIKTLKEKLTNTETLKNALKSLLD
ncbi:XRE family transcriptional regulator [Campylobacter fetus]|uniref:XRE family transcriptional regulator n=1 Tax=Campylobacter fetus TaxID=196 RepID=UPI0011C973B9|nr:XRE family transcriptional regulator [Campylobacter fetus]EAJ1232607.1 XRE family transcriptional regulator [Campylobacter fetus]EAK0414714.1 XRE family transcriptional regulator [Campylobacter fetus]TXF09170.1 XRE family transcriptional regulator [Campylobacter fetus subsp. fetus]